MRNGWGEGVHQKQKVDGSEWEWNGSRMVFVFGFGPQNISGVFGGPPKMIFLGMDIYSSGS